MGAGCAKTSVTTPLGPTLRGSSRIEAPTEQFNSLTLELGNRGVVRMLGPFHSFQSRQVRWTQSPVAPGTPRYDM